MTITLRRLFAERLHHEPDRRSIDDRPNPLLMFYLSSALDDPSSTQFSLSRLDLSFPDCIIALPFHEGLLFHGFPPVERGIG